MILKCKPVIAGCGVRRWKPVYVVVNLEVGESRHLGGTALKEF